MKLGILTFHCAHNYGAILQCFALQQYLMSLGHDVFVIDYKPLYLLREYRKHSWRHWICSDIKLTFRKIVTEPSLWSTRNLRYNAFDRFIKAKLNLYPYKKGMDYSDYDALFLGSDQIWEAPITGGKFDPVFFGKGAKCRVISYAASNKTKELTEKEQHWYKSTLAMFHRVGVREQSLRDLLATIIDKPVYLNVDPTLLANNYLLEGLRDERKIKDRYVLVYEVVEHRKVIDLAKQYAQRLNARVVILDAYIVTDDWELRDQIASPEDFVNYIRYAECVFTTSFHGTAISVLCHTDFYSFKQHNASDWRISSLLEQLGLSQRFVDMSALPDVVRVDYSLITNRLSDIINESRVYVKEALS